MKILSFLLLIPFLFGACNKKQDILSLWQRYQTSTNYDADVCREILDYYSLNQLWPLRDSAMKAFVVKVSWEKNLNVENELYQHYFKEDNYSDLEHAYNLNQQWLQKIRNTNNPNWLFNAYRAEYEFLNSFGEYKKADSSAQKAIYYAKICGDKNILAGSLFNIRPMLPTKKQKVTAFQNFLDALYISKEIEDKTLIQKSLYELANLYESIDEYEKAVDCRQDQIKLYTECNKHIDSMKYFNLLCNYSNALININDTMNANVYAKQVIEYCKRTGNRSLMDEELTTLRSYYTDKDYPEEMKKLYFEEYPEELDSLRVQNPLKYYRTLTFIYDGSENRDSALHYMALSDSAVNQGDYEPSVLSNYYSRCGTLYLKYGQIDKAEKSFLSAYQYADSIQHFPFLLYPALKLDTIYSMKNDYQMAHFYSQKAISYKDSIKETDENPEFIKMSFQNSERERDLKTTQEKKETDRKHNLQYMIIVFVILLSFLLLTVAVSFKIPRYVIKVYGFFFFIMLFEFIILLADHQIHELTHGAPLWILAIKILLIAVLMPLHHWSEEKIVHYFLHHRVVDNFSLKDKWQLLKQRFKTETDNTEEDAPHS